MSLTEEHLNSLDTKVAEMRRTWEGERKTLEDQLLASQLELKLTKAALDDAIKARSNAEMTSAKLVAQFGMVAQVFEDARDLAIEAGLYTRPPGSAATAPPPHLEASLAAIDAAIAPAVEPPHVPT